MNQSRKVLVLGATGAMGQYLVPRLAAMGYRVDGVSIDDEADNIPNVNYIKANAKDRAVLQQLLANSYDGIVDFMIYNSGELPYFLPLLPEHTDHYIYLSSYRVYDNKEHPVRETSPRLISPTVVVKSAEAMALEISEIESPYWFISSSLSSTWIYSRVPPRISTSETPSTRSISGTTVSSI